MKKISFAVIMGAAMAAVLQSFAIEDEPNELNWDVFGGSETGFDHFVKFCNDNPDFKKKLLAEKPVDNVDDKPETVWVTPDAFEKSPVKGWWGIGQVNGDKVLSAGPGHLAGFTRTGVDIPKSGHYRIWAKYWHEQGTTSSFGIMIEEPSQIDNADPGHAIVEDSVMFQFDWSEFARKQNPLPTHKDEPSGWIWESKGPVFIEKGKIALTVSGLVHEGPFANRSIAAIVLTRNPCGIPEKPQMRTATKSNVIVGNTKLDRKKGNVKEYWRRRPLIADGTESLRPYWRHWRKQFLQDLLDGKLLGFEAKRMLSQVYFDETCNLLGTPRQIADEKLAMRKLLRSMELRHWTRKAEGEDFRFDDEGWVYEDNSDASGGKVLQASWDDEPANAYVEFEAPSNGSYTVWVRYHEIVGYNAPFDVLVNDAEGDTLTRSTLYAGGKTDRSLSGFIWAKIPVDLPAGPFSIWLVKDSEGLTARKVDSVIVTDDAKYEPTGLGIVVAPLDKKRPFTVWRQENPWIGFSRLSTPAEDENLEPCNVLLREGEAATVLLLARNNSMKTKEATPEIRHDPEGLITWRVPAFMQTGWYGWQPVPLLRRDNLYIPGCETAGIWLTIEGKPGFKEQTLKVSVGGQTIDLNLVKLPPYDRDTPIPYVFGWTSPMGTRSCWNEFKTHGINVIGDMLVDKSVADEYGIKLTVHLNDSDVSLEHIKWMVNRFEKAGYSKKDWAWSFMDEPGDKTVEYWVDFAKTMRETDPTVQIWVNPGEWEGCSPKAALQMTPYADVYCPYGNHIWSGGVGNEDYYKQLTRDPESDVKFKILLAYTTPCFAEKAASSPMDFLWLKGFSNSAGLDGFAFFALCHAFTYSNSIWDEVDTYMPDQCVNIYPGVRYRTIATRNFEAIREAVQQWRMERDDIISAEREANEAASAAEKKEKAAKRAMRKRIKKALRKAEDNPAARDIITPEMETHKINKTIM